MSIFVGYKLMDEKQSSRLNLNYLVKFWVELPDEYKITYKCIVNYYLFKPCLK